MRNSELGRTGAVRPLWSEADSLRERIAEADSLYGFFSFDTALSQRASHGHLRTNPAARAALIRLCAATRTRGAVLSARKVETMQRRLRLHRLAYVGVHGTDVQAYGLRMVTEPDLELAEKAVQKLRRACSRLPILQAPGIAVEDRTWSLVLHLRHAQPQARSGVEHTGHEVDGRAEDQAEDAYDEKRGGPAAHGREGHAHMVADQAASGTVSCAGAGIGIRVGSGMTSASSAVSMPSSCAQTRTRRRSPARAAAPAGTGVQIAIAR